MGQSTDGILCYGVDLQVEGEDIFDNEAGISFEEAYFEHLNPGKPAPESYDPNNLPVELVRHCHRDYEMFIIAATGTVTSASRGMPEKIENFTIPATADEDIAKAIEFVRRLYPDLSEKLEKPSWLLASYWS